MIISLRRLLLASTIAIVIPVAAQAVSQLPAFETLSEARSYQRDELDLQAQQEMANWAFWMLIVTMISAGVGVFGIYAVLETLKVTQRATDAAHEANELMRQEKRPWLSVKVSPAAVDLQYRPHPKEQYVVTPMLIEITNHGNQPAIYARFQQHTGENYVLGTFDPDKCHVHKSFHESPFNEVIFPGETRSEMPHIQTPFSKLRVAEMPPHDGNSGIMVMSANFYLGVVYVPPGESELMRTTVLVDWNSFVPTESFKEDQGWSHPFQCHQTFGNSVI